MGYKRVVIPAFEGIDQSRGEHGGQLGTSPDAENFVSRNGFLRTARGTQSVYPELPEACEGLRQAFFRDGETREETARLLAFGGGKVYALTGDQWKTLGSGFHGDGWSCVNYRHEAEDWFILTGGGVMKYWDGKSAALMDLQPSQGGEAIAFEQLTLLYERLWGAVRREEPDRVYWSESFAPEDWELNYDTPDAGGGFVDAATFDGSRIRAIVAAFDDVLIFKDKSVHRLNGTYPGEFNLTRVYGSEGTLAAGTIVHTADRLYFLGADGLCVYDGMTVSSLAHLGERKLQAVWKRMNPAAIERARACIYDDVMYLALPLDGAVENSHVVEYSLKEGTYSLMRFAGVKDWLLLRQGQSERLLCLVGKQVYQYDSGTNFCGQAISAYWLSPEITLGTLASKKKVGRVYMSVNAQSIDAGKAPEMKLSLLSGGKVRTKVIALKNGTNQVRKRIKIRGRSFRFRIENVDGNPLTVNRGMEIVLEEDSDL